ncbi:MAG: hypothetical protein AAGM36_16970, partial [Cyanobacteria bacterium J06597_1]
NTHSSSYVGFLQSKHCSSTTATHHYHKPLSPIVKRSPNLYNHPPGTSISRSTLNIISPTCTMGSGAAYDNEQA